MNAYASMATDAEIERDTGIRMLLCQVFNQPVRYGSRRMARSNALVMVYREKGGRSFKIVCFGNRSHYKPDSNECDHSDQILDSMRPWHRARTRVASEVK